MKLELIIPSMEFSILNFARRFQIWAYTVGHGQLLLRSTKSDTLPTRVDILFKSVSAVHLLTTLNGLTVSEASETEKAEPYLAFTSHGPKGQKVFIVRSSGFVGYVAAGTVVWHEDDLEYFQPSHFASSMMTGLAGGRG